MDDPEIITRIAVPADVKYVYTIIEEMERSAIARGTGIARRSPQSVCKKIYEGKAVIALTAENQWAGFSYIEAWNDGEFVSNSGLIVNPAYRGSGIGSRISLCEDLQHYDRRGSAEDESRPWIRAGILFRDRSRRYFLGSVPGLRQLSYPGK